VLAKPLCVCERENMGEAGGDIYEHMMSDTVFNESISRLKV